MFYLILEILKHHIAGKLGLAFILYHKMKSCPLGIVG